MGFSFYFINLFVFLFYLSFPVVVLLIKKKTIKGLFKDIGRKSYIVLIGILFLSLFLRLYSMPYCEDCRLAQQYLDAVKSGSIYDASADFMDFRGIGYFYLLDSFFLLADPIYHNLIALNLFFGILLVFLSFFVSFLIFENKRISLITSFLFGVSPIFVNISLEGSYTMPAVLFATITLLFLFIFIRTKNILFYIASLLLLIATVEIRPDYILLVLVYLLALIIYREGFRDKRLYLVTIIILVLHIPVIWIMYNWYYDLFANDVHFTGEQLDESNLLMSIISNSVRIFLLNIGVNLSLFLFYSALTPIILVLSIGSVRLWVTEKRKGLVFLAIYFAVFFLSYISLHAHGFFHSNLKYIPSVFLPIMYLSSAGMWLIISRLSGKRKITAAVIVFLIISASIIGISGLNKRFETYNDYERYHYITENVQEVNTGCHVIYYGEPTIFRSTFNFEYDRCLGFNSTPELEEIISRNLTGCFYVYLEIQFDDDSKREMVAEYLGILSESRNLEKIFDKALTFDRILLYYFES